MEHQLFSPLSFPLFSLPSSLQVWDHLKQKKEDTDPFKASSCFTLAYSRASIAFIRIMVDSFKALITRAFASFKVVVTSIAIGGFKAITMEQPLVIATSFKVIIASFVKQACFMLAFTVRLVTIPKPYLA